MSMLTIQPSEGQIEKLHRGPFPVNLRLDNTQMDGDWSIVVIDRDAKKFNKNKANGKGVVISVLRVEREGTGFFKDLGKKVKTIGTRAFREATPILERLARQEILSRVPGGEIGAEIAEKAARRALGRGGEGEGVMVLGLPPQVASVIPIGQAGSGVDIAERRLANLALARKVQRKKRGKK